MDFHLHLTRIALFIFRILEKYPDQFYGMSKHSENFKTDNGLQ